MRFPPVMLWMFAALAACLTGCVTRTIAITSEPSGARVFLNEREVGRTPLTCGFTFYGTYDVRLERDGSQALWTQATATQPWWEYPPIDLLAQATGPKEVNVHWHFILKDQPPAAQRNPDEVVARAKAMREINRFPADKANAVLHADGTKP